MRTTLLLIVAFLMMLSLLALWAAAGAFFSFLVWSYVGADMKLTTGIMAALAYTLLFPVGSFRYPWLILKEAYRRWRNQRDRVIASYIIKQ